MVIRDDDDEDDKNDLRLQNPLIAELEKLAKELGPDIARLHNEYNKYFGGAEKRPPIQLRELLNKKAERLKQIMKNSTNLGTTMRVQNAVNQYNTYVAMWDKRIEKMEKSGNSH